MTEAPLDFGQTFRALARRWVLVLVLALAGMAAGMVHHAMVSPTFRAQAVVLLPPAGADSRGNPIRDLATEAQVAMGDEVLAEAGRRLAPPVQPADLRPVVDVGKATDDLLQVRASSTAAAGAAAVANAVAGAYVDVSAGRASDTAVAATAGIQAQATTLNARVRQLNDEIEASVGRLAVVAGDTPEGVRISSAIVGLRADAASAARQLYELNDRIATLRLQADLNRQGTRVVQPATAPKRASSSGPLREAVTGGLAGLLVGLAVAMVAQWTAGSAPAPVLRAPAARHGDGDTSSVRLVATVTPSGASDRNGGGGYDVDDGQLVGVPALMAALRRRRGFCASMAAAGFLASLVLGAAFPVPYTGTVTVMVGHPSGTDPTRNVLTDVELAKTLAVAEGASKDLGGAVSADALRATLRSEALSTELVALKVDGPSAAEAARRAEAVGESFVAFRRDQLGQQWAAASAAIDRRQVALNEELAALDARIAVLAGPDSTTSRNIAGLAELQAHQLTLASQIGALSQQAEAGRFDAQTTDVRTRLVGSGHAPARPLARTTALNILAGILLGFTGAAAWVIVGAIVSDRVRSRAEVSVALGAPVAVSVRARSALRRSDAPANPLARVVRHLGAVLAAPGPDGRRLLVLAVDRVGPVADAVAALARELAADGRSLLLVDVSGEGRFPEVLGVEPGAVVTAGGDPAATVILLGSSALRHPDVETLPSPADTVLVLATLDPAVGAHHLAHWATKTVAVVTAGRSTATWLHSVTEMVVDAGLVLDSVVLLGADPHDRSVGRAPTAPRFSPALRAPMLPDTDPSSARTQG